MKNLIVDIGNSFISFGVFLGDELVERFDVPSDETHVAKIKDLLKSFIKDKKLKVDDFNGGLISSVVPMFTVSIKKAIKEVMGISLDILSKEHFSDIEMIVDNRDEVGGDIIADVKAAKTLYKGPALVIDLGTITKNIVIDKNGKFIGVSFFPGVEACISSMRDKTALLPGFTLKEKPAKLLGNNTIEAMESGVFYGTLNGLKSLSKEIEDKMGQKLIKILTGGSAFLFAPYLSDFIYDKDFVLKGINFLYKKGV